MPCPKKAYSFLNIPVTKLCIFKIFFGTSRPGNPLYRNTNILAFMLQYLYSLQST